MRLGVMAEVPRDAAGIVASAVACRVRADGAFLDAGGRAFRVRGVTYGSFRDRGDGFLFPDSARIRSDFRDIAGAGLNTVRTYGLPPPEAFDFAREFGLRLVVGLHYDDWRSNRGPSRATNRRVLEAGRRAVADAMAVCAGRPEVLAVSIGNEVPGDLVRLHRPEAVAGVLGALAEAVHAADPAMLVTYSNYPTTEYLQVPHLDFISFNIFLEERTQFRSYLRHLRVIAGDRPLVISEMGLASAMHGEAGQAETLEWQLSEVDESGCAGATVFSWTDEWSVGGKAVEGWGFGITDARRRPKPAVDTVQRWARRPLEGLRPSWPSISVVVCSYNAAGTIDECLASLAASPYPALDVIVCDDGSTDATVELARRHPFPVLQLAHGGLGAARNAGIRATRGEIVAFLDSDARIHSEWPYHLALAFDSPAVAAAGGPNLPVPGAGFVETAVASAPGNPTHVLLGDDRAEHVPGCNMAFARHALQEIGGFDLTYTTAGDDVDVCWKVLDRGYEIAFSPQIQVRHHRRSTVRAYLRQQRGYGRSEKAVSLRHRHRFNRFGQARWSGSIYGGPRVLPRLLRPVVYHGWLGQAPFQKIHRHRAEPVLAIASAYLPVVVPIAALGALLATLNRWWLVVPAAMLAALVAFGGVVVAAAEPPPSERRRLAHRLLVGYLHVVQPLVRTWARLRGRAAPAATLRTPSAWLGDRPAWLREIERELRARDLHVAPGRPTDSFDFEVSSGLLVRGRVTTAVAWSWYPLHRLSFRPTRAACLAVLAVLLLGLSHPAAGAAMAVVSLVLAGLDRLLLGRIIGDTLRRTSRAAVAPPRVQPAGEPMAGPEREASRP